jgi:DNA-binding NarL/FixJ family response regulator
MMIRVVVIDDHPALRAGLQTVLDGEPGIVYAGESDGSEESLWPLLRRVNPDVVLLDFHLPKGDGLQFCYRIKQQVPAPGVIIFSAYASPDMMLAAQLAKADAVLNKGVEARELFGTIRAVAAGESALSAPSATALQEAHAHIADPDRAVVGMLLDGTPDAEVARTVGGTVADVRHAVQRTLSALRHSTPIGG